MFAWSSTGTRVCSCHASPRLPQENISCRRDSKPFSLTFPVTARLRMVCIPFWPFPWWGTEKRCHQMRCGVVCCPLVCPGWWGAAVTGDISPLHPHTNTPSSCTMALRLSSAQLLLPWSWPETLASDIPWKVLSFLVFCSAKNEKSAFSEVLSFPNTPKIRNQHSQKCSPFQILQGMSKLNNALCFTLQCACQFPFLLSSRPHLRHPAIQYKTSTPSQKLLCFYGGKQNTIFFLQDFFSSASQEIFLVHFLVQTVVK